MIADFDNLDVDAILKGSIMSTDAGSGKGMLTMLKMFDSLEEFKAAFKKKDLTNDCLVIRGYCLDWPLHRDDRFAYLSQEYGNDEILIEQDIMDNVNKHTTTMTISDYIERLLNGTRVMGNWSWQPHLTHPEKLSQSFFIPPEIAIGDLAICPWLLMSGPETTTSIHQDMLNVNGVAGQLIGSKLFTLVAPEYALSEGKYYSNESLEELEIPFTQIVLNAGDFLYFPKLWWHQAKTLYLSATLIHSTVNHYNLNAFLNETVKQMPHFIQRLQLSAKKRGYFGNKINWLSNGFRILE